MSTEIRPRIYIFRKDETVMGLFDLIKKLTPSTVAPPIDPCPAARSVMANARSLRTDLVILSVHGATCPECAKYQGRVFSLSGSSKLFPRVPDAFFRFGCIHEGCGHTFSPYIHGVNDPDLRYTLSVHQLQDKRYGRDIIAFSNRPFIDDRTDSCRRAAEKDRQKFSEELAQRRYWEEHKGEFQAKLAAEEKDFAWIQANLPDKCPKTISSYRRMKTQNSKGYQALKQAAAELGRDI